MANLILFVLVGSFASQAESKRESTVISTLEEDHKFDEMSELLGEVVQVDKVLENPANDGQGHEATEDESSTSKDASSFSEVSADIKEETQLTHVEDHKFDEMSKLLGEVVQVDEVLQNPANDGPRHKATEDSSTPGDEPSFSEVAPISREQEQQLTQAITMIQQQVETYLETSEETIGDVMGKTSDVGLMDVLFKAQQALSEKESLFAKANLEQSKARYNNTLSKAKVKDFFAKDGIGGCIGKTRIISLPDRVFGNLKKKVEDGCGKQGVKHPSLFRPTLMACNKDSFLNLQTWAPRWLHYILEEDHTCETGKGVYQYFLTKDDYAKYQNQAKKACDGKDDTFLENMQQPINMAIMHLYVFDALLLHMGGGKYLNVNAIRMDACDAFVYNKRQNEAKVLTPYMTGGGGQADIITLVEVGSDLPPIDPTFLAKYFVVKAPDMGKKDQNSVVLVRKDRFDQVSEDTPVVSTECKKTGADKNGDVWMWPLTQPIHKCKEPKDKSTPWHYDLRELVMGAFKTKINGIDVKVAVAAFHASSEGLESKDVVSMAYEEAVQKGYSFLMGADANTFSATHANPEKEASVKDFYQNIPDTLYSGWHKGGTYVETPEIIKATATTYKIRSKVQAQPAKGEKKAAMKDPAKVDRHPKDHELYSANHWELEGDVVRRNHFNIEDYDAEAKMPNFQWPSDHALLEATFVRKERKDLKFKMVHWNVAGPQQNPFEFWM